MSVLQHIFQVLFLYHISAPTMSFEDCEIQENMCSCRFKNDSIISLKALNVSKPPRFSGVETLFNGSSKETYFYDPCSPFTEGSKGNKHEDDCNYYSNGHVVVCQQKDSVYWNLGDLTSAKFMFNKTNWYISYEHNMRSTNVSLICSHLDEPNLIVLGELNRATEGISRYHMELHSKCACVDGCVPSDDDDDTGSGMSTFQFIVLFIFLAILLYFVGGIVYRKMRYGATGREMIPHYEFWSTCGVKLQELVRYLASGCKTSQESNYDQI